MITKDELEELLREHGLAPYVYIKSEKEQFNEPRKLYHMA